MKAIQLVVIALVLASGILAQSCSISRNVPEYKQCSYEWGNNRFGASSTICSAGCLMCSVAAGLSSIGATIDGQTPDCGVLNSYLIKNGGYQGNLFVWNAVERFGLRYEGQTTNIDALKKAVCDQKVVVVNVDAGKHWVIVTGYSGNTFDVKNSGGSQTQYSLGDIVRGGIYRTA